MLLFYLYVPSTDQSLDYETLFSTIFKVPINCPTIGSLIVIVHQLCVIQIYYFDSVTQGTKHFPVYFQTIIRQNRYDLKY